MSVYRQYDGRNPIGYQLTVHGDGTTAHLVSPVTMAQERPSTTSAGSPRSC